ncbi:uncharacterized protein LOC124159543 [Ischnura elegans]|uniref:uncharacterized protein LOC124159543 n=1 Tax=Ischnura elegans TaxID=197161 RepID=UPI001ED86F5D|nr:uncharacterized protein LOC124159543 [Ischnura elegans]
MQTMKLILLTILVTLACLPDLGLCQDPPTPYTRTCIKEGVICETCTKAVFCLPDPEKEGQFIPDEESATECKGEFSCDELYGGCVFNGVCRFNANFHCPLSDNVEPIKYPDPYNCKNFYTCPGRNPVAETCTDGQAFDPKTGNCSDISGDLCKDYPVPLCKEKCKSHVIAGTNYSYECLLGFTADGIEILYPMFQSDDSATTNAPIATSPKPVHPSTKMPRRLIPKQPLPYIGTPSKRR